MNEHVTVTTLPSYVSIALFTQLTRADSRLLHDLQWLPSPAPNHVWGCARASRAGGQSGELVSAAAIRFTLICCSRFRAQQVAKEAAWRQAGPVEVVGGAQGSPWCSLVPSRGLRAWARRHSHRPRPRRRPHPQPRRCRHRLRRRCRHHLPCRRRRRRRRLLPLRHPPRRRVRLPSPYSASAPQTSRTRASARRIRRCPSRLPRPMPSRQTAHSPST